MVISTYLKFCMHLKFAFFSLKFIIKWFQKFSVFYGILRSALPFRDLEGLIICLLSHTSYQVTEVRFDHKWFILKNSLQFLSFSFCWLGFPQNLEVILLCKLYPLTDSFRVKKYCLYFQRWSFSADSDWVCHPSGKIGLVMLYIAPQWLAGNISSVMNFKSAMSLCKCRFDFDFCWCLQQIQNCPRHSVSAFANMDARRRAEGIHV